MLFNTIHKANAFGCCMNRPRQYRPQVPRNKLSYSTSTRSTASTSTRTASSAASTSLRIHFQSIVDTFCNNSITICNLQNKGITDLTTLTFPSNITTLNLSNNHIGILDGVKFPSQLTHLDLSSNLLYQHSRAQTVWDLSYLQSLRTLNLDNNRIRGLSKLILPKRLEILYISKNGITSFNNVGDLTYLASLTLLTLDSNDFKTLRGNIANQLPNSLSYLSLKNNALTQVAISVPPSLFVLDLRNNPLNQYLILPPIPDGLIVEIDPPRQSQIMRRLPTLIWRMEIERRCDICCELFEQGDTIRTLPCLHQYHCGCIDPWLNQHQTCPECRHNINDVDQMVEAADDTGWIYT